MQCSEEPRGEKKMAATDQDGRGVNTLGSTSSSDASAKDERKYTKLPGFATTEGQDYEVKMSALLFAKGLNSKGEFQLGTNVAGAGALDDIVYKFTTPDQVCHTAFIQLKHKKTARVNMDSLVRSRGDFSLAKYFEAFMDIKQALKGNVEQPLFSGTLESFNFAVFTNAPLHQGKGGVETRDLPSPIDELIKLNEVETNFTECELERIYSDLNTEEEKLKKLPKYAMSSNEDDAKEFLKRFKLFTGQPSEDQLDDVIKEELKKFGIEKKYLDAVLRQFLERMKTWWQQSKGVILNQNSTILLEANAGVMLQTRVEQLTEHQVGKFRLNVKFLERSTEEMKDAFTNQLSLVHVPSRQMFRMTASKVLQTLEPQRDKYIFLSLESLLKEREAVMSSWRHGKNNLLVLVCNETISEEKEKESVAELTDVLKEKKDKKLILISDSSNSFATKLKEMRFSNLNIFQDAFHMSQLGLESINHILKKDVIFQGTPTTLGSLIGDDLNCISKELCEILETIIESEPLVIGDNLKEDIKYYVPRTMQCKNIVNKKIFLDQNFAGRIQIHGATLADADDFVANHEHRIRKRFQQSREGIEFNAYDEDNKYIGANTHDDVHYFEWNDRKLVWKRTKGNINTVKKYINVASSPIINPEDRVVLVIAEPGMGKTTLLTHEAQQSKQTHPGSWVVSITLSNHTSLLAKAKKHDLDAEQFLSSALGLDKMPAINQSMFRYGLNQRGNVAVFLDGLDEVAPRYTDECLTLIGNILKTKVSKVWISSRFSLKHSLETHLSKPALTLRKFNEEDQRRFLVNYWKSNNITLSIEYLNEFISKIMCMTSQTMNDKERDFTGIPLQSRMLADVFADYLTDSGKVLPEKLNVLELIEQFVEKKFKTFNQKQLNSDETHPDYKRNLEEKRKIFVKKHSNIILILLYGETDLQTPIDKTECEMFIKSIETGEERTGIIERVVDGKPVFLHRVFAEYFAALWFSEHYHSNTDFMSEHLLSETFDVVRHMFDRILARNNELHNAVLNSDEARVEDMLRGGSDVNSTDKGGRTALHLAIISGLHIPSEDKPNIPIIEILVNHNASLEVKDKVLQWTPVQYADSSKLWAEINTLLKHACIDTSLFTITKQNIDDEDMWESIVKHDFANVLSLLLDFSQTHTSPFRTVFEKIRTRLTNFNASEFMKPKSLLLKSAEYGGAKVARLLIDRTSGVTSQITNQNSGSSTSDASSSRSKMSLFNRIALKKLLNAQDRRNNRNALMISSQHSNIAIVKTILDSYNKLGDISEYINRRDAEGITALLLASSGGHGDLVDLLITHGADVTARGTDGLTGIMLASESGHISVVRSLLAAINDERKKSEYVNTRDVEGTSALWLAAREGYGDIVNNLIACGADVTAKDNDGWTGLMAASRSGYITLVTALLATFDEAEKRSEYVNTRDDEGASSLWLACNGGHHKIVDILIAGGADVIPRDNDGDSGLMAASRSGSVSVITSLLATFKDEREKAVYINTCDYKGRSALWWACTEGHHDIVDILLSDGADVTARDNDGWTGLMKASEAGHSSVVRSLLASFNDDKKKAEYINTFDDEGVSALFLASSEGHDEIFDLLVAGFVTGERV